MRRKDRSDSNVKNYEGQEADVYSNLQQKRALFLTHEINSDSANRIAAQLIALDLESQKDIFLVINSEGGNVTDTMAVYDIMQGLKSDVSTICMGEAASGAAILLTGGAKGKRYMLPNARVMLHQPQGGVEGSSRDVEIEATELTRLREVLSRLIGRHTGLSAKKLHSVLDRDTYLNASQAVEMGVADDIIDRMPFA